MNKPDSYNEIMPLISDNTLKAHVQNEWARFGFNRGIEEIVKTERHESYRLIHLINLAVSAQEVRDKVEELGLVSTNV